MLNPARSHPSWHARLLSWALVLGPLVGTSCHCHKPGWMPGGVDYDAGIPDETTGPGPGNAGRRDGSVVDAGVLDGGGWDGGAGDAGEEDGGNLDGGGLDGALSDGGAGDGAVDDDGGSGDGGAGDGGGSQTDGGGLQYCLSCHGSDGNPAPPRDTQDRWDRSLSTVGAHRTHLRSSPFFRTGLCEECHQVPTSTTEPLHLNGQTDMVWGPVANAKSVSSAYTGVTCTTYCHGVTLRGGVLTQPEWTTTSPRQAFCGSCHGAPPPMHPVAAQSGCSGCHPFNGFVPLDPQRHVNGILDVNATCGSCHGVPPETPGHFTHAVGAPAVYGGLAMPADQATPTGYSFGCGHCHPTDERKHMDGTLQVQLYDTGAAAGSLKARNPSTASYTPGPVQFTDTFGMTYSAGTCSNMACHSGQSTLAPVVPEPGVDFVFDGSSYPIVYPAYDVQRPVFYRSATWGGTLSCAGCHDYPPRSDSPAAIGGAGNSHASIGPDGYEGLHMFNHAPANEPVPCRACHSATVNVKATWARDVKDHTTFDDIPIADVTKHVNGQTDVLINTSETITMFSTPMSLTNMTWDGTAMTCTNAPCHLEQTQVKWGAPYRWVNGGECNNCHRY